MVQQANLLPQFISRLTNNVGKALEAAGMLVEDKAQTRAPLWTGTMMRSVTHTPVMNIGGDLVVFVGPGPEAPYAIYTEDDRYMPKRPGPKSRLKGATLPWLRPALHDCESDIRAMLAEAVRRSIP